MSGEVLTTIHGYVKEYGIYVALFLAVVGAYYTWAGRGITWTFALTRTRQLNSLRKMQARLKHLHDSDGVCGWLLSGILWVLFLFGVQLMLEASPAAQHGLLDGLLDLARFIVGYITMVVSANRLTWYRRLEHYDTTMAWLDRAIARLEAKQAVRQPAAAV